MTQADAIGNRWEWKGVIALIASLSTEGQQEVDEMAVDVISTLATNAGSGVFVALGAAALRAVSGWVENALADGEVSSFEWGQLLSTGVKYFSYTVLLMFGLPIEQAVVGTFALDKAEKILGK